MYHALPIALDEEEARKVKRAGRLPWGRMRLAALAAFLGLLLLAPGRSQARAASAGPCTPRLAAPPPGIQQGLRRVGGGV